MKINKSETSFIWIRGFMPRMRMQQVSNVVTFNPLVHAATVLLTVPAAACSHKNAVSARSEIALG